MNRNFKCVLSVARSEYIKWITNPRVIIVGVLLVFMRTLAIEPLLERAAKMEIPLNILEPFVAIGNSGMLVMLMPCVFMVLISDYPKMTGNTLFFIRRTGRFNWFAGQVIFLFMSIISFLCVVLTGSYQKASFQQRGVMLLQNIPLVFLMKQTALPHRFCLQICIIRYLLLQRSCKRLLLCAHIFSCCQ